MVIFAYVKREHGKAAEATRMSNYSRIVSGIVIALAVFLTLMMILWFIGIAFMSHRYGHGHGDDMDYLDYNYHPDNMGYPDYIPDDRAPYDDYTDDVTDEIYEIEQEIDEIEDYFTEEPYYGTEEPYYGTDEQDYGAE